jgi:hypothetical protein
MQNDSDEHKPLKKETKNEPRPTIHNRSAVTGRFCPQMQPGRQQCIVRAEKPWPKPPKDAENEAETPSE